MKKFWTIMLVFVLSMFAIVPAAFAHSIPVSPGVSVPPDEWLDEFIKSSGADRFDNRYVEYTERWGSRVGDIFVLQDANFKFSNFYFDKTSSSIKAVIKSIDGSAYHDYSIRVQSLSPNFGGDTYYLNGTEFEVTLMTGVNRSEYNPEPVNILKIYAGVGVSNKVLAGESFNKVDFIQQILNVIKVVLPVGIIALAIFLGVKLIPKIVRRFY